MKFLYTLLLLLILGTSSRADHVLGGDLTYEYLSGNSYKIILTVYGECSGSSFPHLTHAEPRITVLNEKGALFTLVLTEEADKRKEVTVVCPAEAANTTCRNPEGTIPGSMRFVYTAVTELSPAEKWRMIFMGQMDNTGKMQSGFTFLISNVKNNTGFGFYLLLEATLNNAEEHNSSASYTISPTPSYCINKAQEYSPGAVDKDDDDLYFSLIPPFDINGITTVYNAPYTPRQPFSTAGPLDYNMATGQMSFTPNKTEVVLVVHKTEEYRNSTLVGSTMRAMTVFIKSGCNNDLPNGNIDPASVTGAKYTGNAVNTCKEEEWVRFKVPVRDGNNEKIDVILSNLPPGANATVNNNNTAYPEIEFSWNVTNIKPRTYTFYANYNDGACPAPGIQTMAYTINIAYPVSIFHQVLAPTNCKHRQFVQFNIDGGMFPRKVVVTDTDNKVVARYEDRRGIITDSFKIGRYKVFAYVDNLPCSAEYEFEVKDDGIYPDPPYIDDADFCLHGEIYQLHPLPVLNSTIQWYDMQGNRLAEAPIYTTDSVRGYKWMVNQKVKVCESVFDTVNVVVHPLPEVNILNQGGKACHGDGIYLDAKGGIRYEWQPADKVKLTDKGFYTFVNEAGNYVVKGYSKYNCVGTDTLTFTDIEQCCRFSYPDAFTPNADGINDGWHPLTYGNVDLYLLSIYNRWGERVYVSSDPKQKWDGLHGGIPCDVGTYYYKLRANCVIGRKEEESGSFLLIR